MPDRAAATSLLAVVIDIAKIKVTEFHVHIDLLAALVLVFGLHFLEVKFIDCGLVRVVQLVIVKSMEPLLFEILPPEERNYGC